MTSIRLSACLFSSLLALPGLAFAGAEPAKLVGAPAALPEEVQAAAHAIEASGDAGLRVVGTGVVTRLTGPDAPNDTAARWDVYGTDLGHMFRHRDRLYMVFGDTFGPPGLGGENWRSNAMALIADPDPRSGLPFESMITGPDGAAKELLASRKTVGVEQTVIPTQGISIDGRIYLHYMSVRFWGPVGGVWVVRHSGLAYSDDDGQSWTTPETAVWQRGTGFEQVAFAVDDGLLYTFGIPEGRFGGVKLRRVAPDRILEKDAYEYWTGTEWASDRASAALVVPAPVGELSVAWSESHRVWLMMHLDPVRHAVMLRTAPALTGPWGEAQVVTTAEDYPGLYAPYIVPGTDIDTDLYYTMSRWGPYNVFLMHTTLEPAAPAVASADDSAAPDDTGAAPGTPSVTN